MLLRAKGSEIKRRREGMRLSKYRLSMLAGLGPLAVTRMEEELHLVHPLRAKAIAEILGCTVEDLFEANSIESDSKVSSM